jgi:hypothetical protein
MSKPTLNATLLALLVLLLLVTVLYAKKSNGGHHTSVQVLETKNELIITADYPNNMSEKVQDKLQAYLKMHDVNNLDNVEITNYLSPDQHLKFNINTNDGHVKIWLDKRENNANAYARMKETGTLLKQVLVH